MRTATTLSVLVLGAGGIGHAVVTSLDTGIGRVDPFKDMKNRPNAGRGLNLLLVGTDGRDKITEEERQKYRLGGAPCHCTDTVMLVHLSEDGRRASVVSLPRDSYTELPEHTDATTGKRHAPHPVKLNAAYAEGGPRLTVGTVERMTGVKISHYLEVDFTAFMKTVDALGGVDICTPRPLKDSYTGLDLAPGTHRMNGGEALQYVRSRHIDGAADLGRMQRQQRFLAALIHRATSSGVLLNPVRFKEVTSTMLDSVRADAGFGARQLLDLNEAMRGFSPASSEFTSVPLAGDGSGVTVKGIGSTVKWDPVKSKQLFRAVRDDKPLTPRKDRPAHPSKSGGSGSGESGGSGSGGKGEPVKLVDVKPQEIRVQVYNGTATDGLGKRVDDALHATGFNTTRAPLTSDGPDAHRTVVMYDPRWDRSAKSLAAALPGSELRAVKQQGATLKVMAGTDYKAVTPVRAEEAPKGEFGATTGDQAVCA
ncbi:MULTISPECIES: LCP family protein [unclassified Streptomyces]|uniref:LCP family protein n=1 Tax=Streptomyces sp. NPDC091212 TaxID=3155191 RepID=UPI002E2CE71D|nr:LCP family protein [Streptomyces sp. NBC_01429]